MSMHLRAIRPLYRGSVSAGLEMLLKETDFIEKVVARGKHSAGDLKNLAQRVARWAADPDSISAVCECEALARKPK